MGALGCTCAQAQTQLQTPSQSNVQLYGSIDDGLDYVSNVGGKHLVSVDSGKRSPDRFGIRGTEELGGGRKAFFKLETGFNSDVGTQANPNKLFNRYATVGITDSSLGTLTLGHMPDFAYDYVGALNNSVPGVSWSYSPGNLDNLANVFGSDNVVRYETPDIGGLQLGVMNGFGEDPNNFSRSRQYSTGFRYARGPLRLGGSYSMYHNRTADLKTVFGVKSVLGQSLATAPFNADRFSTATLGGSYQIGMFAPHATASQVKLENSQGAVFERNLQAGVNIDLSGGKKRRILGLSMAHTTFMDKAYNQYNLFASQYMGLFSLNTQVYAGASYIHASGPGAVAGAFGFGASDTPKQVLMRVGVQVQF